MITVGKLEKKLLLNCRHFQAWPKQKTVMFALSARNVKITAAFATL